MPTNDECTLEPVAPGDPIIEWINNLPFDHHNRRLETVALYQALANLLNRYSWTPIEPHNNEYEAWRIVLPGHDLSVKLATYPSNGPFGPMASVELGRGGCRMWASSVWRAEGSTETAGSGLEGHAIEGLKWRVGGQATPEGPQVGDHYVQTEDVVHWMLAAGGFPA